MRRLSHPPRLPAHPAGVRPPPQGGSVQLNYARELGLDVSRFVRDLQEHRHLPKVRRDFLQGVRNAVNGTPTLFIDGQRWNGPYDADSLLAARTVFLSFTRRKPTGWD